MAGRTIRGMNKSIKPHLKIDDIIKAVSEHYNYSVKDLLGPRKLGDLANARMVLYYFGYHYTALSSKQLGKRLNRDHTSIQYGFNRAQEFLANDEHMQQLDLLFLSQVDKIGAEKRAKELAKPPLFDFGVDDLTQRLERKVA